MAAVCRPNRAVVGGCVFADKRIFACRGDHAVQIVGGGYVLEIQTGGFVETAVVHAQALRFGIHGSYKRRHTARIGAAQRVCCAVFAAHQAQVQQFAARQRCADGKAAARTFQAVDFISCNSNALVHIQTRVQNDHRAHQFGNGRDRHHAVCIFLIQDFACFVVKNQGGLRCQKRPRHHRLSLDFLCVA